jgi:proline iminopeptidase
MLKAKNSGYLPVSALHEIWFEEYGNPKGIPVVLLHGGPGAGGNPKEIELFNLEKWRVILLDQRGAGRSKPFAELRENTTQNLVNDIERLRTHLNIRKWIVYGGSWGTALGMAYGQAYPDQVMGFILRGIFLANKKAEQQILLGMRDYFPDAWQEMANHLTKKEQENIITSLYNRILSQDAHISEPAAYAFMKYDLNCAFLNILPDKLEEALKNKNMVMSIAKIFSHYAKNDFFLSENELINNIEKINHIPTIILNGRYDVITIPKSAYQLHERWKNSKLIIVEKSGHSALDEQMQIALREAIEIMLKEIG